MRINLIIVIHSSTGDKVVSDTKLKPFAFVVMPFAKEFDDVYRFGIKSACIDAGAYCERVDEQIFHEDILDRVYNQLSRADVIIADMTHRNPNVFYEVGYAHALGKKVILLTQSSEDIPFDLKHYPHIIYGGSIGELKDQIQKRMAWMVEHPDAPVRDTQFPLELFIKGTRLAAGGVTDVRLKSSSQIFLDFTNITQSILTHDDFELNVIVNDRLSELNTVLIKLPNGSIMKRLEYRGRLFPEAWGQTPLILVAQSGFTCDIRVFTKTGSRDFGVRFAIEIET